MLKKSAFLTLLFCFLLLCFCSSELKYTQLFDADGINLGMAVRTIEESELSVDQFQLEAPVIITEQNKALRLSGMPFYQETTVTLLLDGNVAETYRISQSSLALATETIVPVGSGVQFDEIHVSVSADTESGKLVPVGTTSVVLGVRFTSPIVLHESSRAVIEIENPHTTYRVDVSHLRSLIDSRSVILGTQITYTALNGNSLERLYLRAKSAETQQDLELEIIARPGTHNVVLYEGICGFPPDLITLVFDDAAIRVDAVELVSTDRSGALPDIEPLSADLYAIVGYDRSFWRRADFELFSWTLFPDILVFDTVDYVMQSSFFKRLAFYVEKKNSVGKLLSNSQLAGQHGWNAHDYWADDLAAFFAQAGREELVLNEAEEKLRQIVISRAIIVETADGYRPGVGGVLSISQESDLRLRYLFMMHEGYHGVYFSKPELRERVRQVWMKLSNPEREFWRLFLSWRNYDTNNISLVENEMFAYLQQQSQQRVDEYFWDYLVPNLESQLPSSAAQIAYLRENFPGTFKDTATSLEKILFDLAGIKAENLMCLVPFRSVDSTLK